MSLRPTVFISYSHDSPEHADAVLAFSNRLRAEGFESTLDQYETSPAEGWPHWMDRHIREDDFVLMVCTETYYRRVMKQEKPGVGRGVRWEGHLIYQHLYDAGAENIRFIPVLFSTSRYEHIPEPVRSATHYPVYTEGGFNSLRDRLLGNAPALRPPLGPLSPRPRNPDYPNLTEEDSAVLALACEHAINKGSFWMEARSLSAQAAALGIGSEMFQESLDILSSRGYLKDVSRIPGTTNIYVFALTNLAFRQYLESQRDDYQALRKQVVSSVITDGARDSATIAAALGEPEAVVQHVLQVFSEEGRLKTFRLIGSQEPLRILDDIPSELKRWLRAQT